MRSWTTFAIFGGFLVVLVIYSILAQFLGNPAMGTAKKFIAAVNRNDAAAVEKLVDPSAATVVKAGNSLASISFKEANPFDGPFVRYDAVIWGYTELNTIKIDPKSDAHILEKTGLATIQLSSGDQMCLRRSGNDWKVIYISKGPNR